MKIHLRHLNTIHPDDEVVIEPSAMQEVTLTEVFNGVELRTEEGEKLGVCMRDGGFEVHYYGKVFDAGWIRFVNGILQDDGSIAEPDLLYEAWGVIANAGWEAQSPEWKEAAERWRDRWHATLPSAAVEEAPWEHVADALRHGLSDEDFALAAGWLRKVAEEHALETDEDSIPPTVAWLAEAVSGVAPGSVEP